MGALCSHLKSEIFLISIKIPSTAWSSSWICDARYPSGSSGPLSITLSEAAIPTLSVSVMPRPRCLASVSAAILTTAFSWANFFCLALSLTSTVCASLNSAIRCKKRVCASLMRKGESPSPENPNPSNIAGQPVVITRSSPS